MFRVEKCPNGSSNIVCNHCGWKSHLTMGGSRKKRAKHKELCPKLKPEIPNKNIY